MPPRGVVGAHTERMGGTFYSPGPILGHNSERRRTQGLELKAFGPYASATGSPSVQTAGVSTPARASHGLVVRVALKQTAGPGRGSHADEQLVTVKPVQDRTVTTQWLLLALAEEMGHFVRRRQSQEEGDDALRAANRGSANPIAIAVDGHSRTGWLLTSPGAQGAVISLDDRAVMWIGLEPHRPPIAIETHKR